MSARWLAASAAAAAAGRSPARPDSKTTTRGEWCRHTGGQSMFCGPCLPAAATKAATHSETAAACGPEVIRAIVLEDSLCLLHGLWRGKARELRPAGSGQRLACEQPVAVGRWFCCGSPLPLSLRCQQRVPPTDRTRTGGGATGGGVKGRKEGAPCSATAAVIVLLARESLRCYPLPPPLAFCE